MRGDISRSCMHTEIIKNYENRKLKVVVNPKTLVTVDEESGEIIAELQKSIKAKTKLLTIIVDPHGKPLYPHNFYLNDLLKKGNKNTTTAAQALLAFTRYITSIDLTYRSVTDDPEESPAWYFADYLLDTLTVADPVTGEYEDRNGYLLSTARTYIGEVINFYKWLHRENILPINDKHKSLDFKYVTITRNADHNHDLLSHIKGTKHQVAQTTSLMQRFPKNQSTPPWMKLKPLKPEDRKLFERFCDEQKGAGEVKALMCRLAMLTGVRMQELVTLPEEKIVLPLDDIPIPFTISPANGCETKFGKQRNIEIPYELMMELFEYKVSEAREENLRKAGIELDVNDLQIPIERNDDDLVQVTKLHGRLFVSDKGKPYAKNTIQSFLSEARRHIRKAYPNWYYRPHDLRATFATYWLGEEATGRKVLFDYLMQELAVLMGHESTATTQKYIDFMSAKNVKIEHSAMKNAAAQKALKGKS